MKNIRICSMQKLHITNSYISKERDVKLLTEDIEKDSIVLYKSNDGKVEFSVTLKEETIWLTQKEMSELFDKSVKTINEHISNIFKEDELYEFSVIRNFRITASDGKSYNVKKYNLDVIISVGYRVKSQRGTQFRKWATSILKQHLIEGYTINQKRLQEKVDKLQELMKVIDMVARTSEEYAITEDQAKGLLKVITHYKYGLEILDKYDHQELQIKNTTEKQGFIITYEQAIKEIEKIKKVNTSSLFANEKDNSFKSSIGAIYQTFGGKDVYPSIEEKSANLLYFIVKNHAFSDGNKRIAAMMFLWYLDENGILYEGDGTKRIADNTLVALTLLIAESKSNEKDMMIKVIVNLINKDN